MSAAKNVNPFLKKAAGEKPPTHRDIKRGLNVNRGLAALVGSPKVAVVPASVAAIAPAAVPVAAPAVVPAAGGVLEVPPMDIERCPWQPRSDFQEESLKELSDSIKANGIIQPLVCRRRADGKYELIAGERRLRASVMAGLKKVKIVVIEATDRKVAEMAVTENIQRQDLNPIEEAEGYRLLQDNFELTQEQVAERTGKSRSTIANATRLLELPDEVKQFITQGLVSTGHAKVLLGVDDDKQRVLFARDVVTDGLTVRALEKKVARLKEPVRVRKAGTPDIPESYARALADEIRKRLGCAARLTSAMTHANGKRTKGVLEIDFYGNDDLDRILKTLDVKMD